MTESRDRLNRAIDVAGLFSRHRESVLGPYNDQPELARALSSPGVPQPSASELMPESTGSPAVGRGTSTPLWMSSGRRSHGTGNGRHQIGRGGSRLVRRGGTRVLPSWHPRTPLRDITSIVVAVEELRRLRETELHGVGSPNSSEQTPVRQFIHSAANMSPFTPKVGYKRCPPSVRVQNVLHKIVSRPVGGMENLTPQKKLLNSIDTVENVLTGELQRIKRSPSAMKVERERKVRTLMSFR